MLLNMSQRLREGLRFFCGVRAYVFHFLKLTLLFPYLINFFLSVDSNFEGFQQLAQLIRITLNEMKIINSSFHTLFYVDM
jgi:hypothetical protein